MGGGGATLHFSPRICLVASQKNKNWKWVSVNTAVQLRTIHKMEQKNTTPKVRAQGLTRTKLICESNVVNEGHPNPIVCTKQAPTENVNGKGGSYKSYMPYRNCHYVVEIYWLLLYCYWIATSVVLYVCTISTQVQYVQYVTSTL